MLLSIPPSAANPVPSSLPSLSAFVINEAIQARTVRLVFKEEGSSGPPTSIVVSRQEALAKAKEVGLDLVLGKGWGGKESWKEGRDRKGGVVVTHFYIFPFFIACQQQQLSPCANSPSLPTFPPVHARSGHGLGALGVQAHERPSRRVLATKEGETD